MREDPSQDALIGLIYDCVLRDDRLVDLLRAVSARFGVDSAILVYVDPLLGQADFSLAHGVVNDPAVQLSYRRDFASLDPAPATMSGLKLGQAASTDLVFASTMGRFKPFIEGFLQPLGLGGALIGVVANADSKIGFFALHRPIARRPFDEDDVSAFETLLPHIVRMLALRHSFYTMKTRMSALDRAVETTVGGVMVLDADGVLLHANAASRALLARDDGLGLDRFGALLARDQSARKGLRAAIAGKRGDTRIVLCPRTHAGLPYALRIRRDQETGCSIHIWDPAHDIGDVSSLLTQALGLTASSASLVSALLGGETLDAYAARAAVTRSTAKFHLSAAFAASGTRRQSDLLKLAGALVRDLGTAPLAV